MIRYSFKQMLRQPVKALVFFLLMTAATALAVFGAAMYAQTAQRIEAAESRFATVGTVSQPWQSVRYETEENDCEGEQVTAIAEYGDLITPEQLNFPAAEYVLPPESRPYYLASLPDKNPNFPAMKYYNVFEFEALEASTDGGLVHGRVTDLLFTGTMMGGASGLAVGSEVSVCQHGAAEVVDIVPGKTYIGCFEYAPCAAHGGNEFYPCRAPFSSQCQPDGTPVEGGYFPAGLTAGNCARLEEVTADFYKPGGHGQDWLNFIQEIEMIDHCFPVLAANSLDLLPSYRQGKLAVTRGREVTQEEFDAGARVCMVSQEFASKNLIYEGDTITLPLVCSLYGFQSTNDVWFDFMENCSLLDAQGQLYEPFWEAEYEVVGIFSRNFGGGEELAFQDMLIIPQKSAAASDAANIAYYGPMKDFTASFQIPNGTVEAFDQALREAVPGIAGLEIQYNDMGYTRTINSLQNAGRTALLLLAAGILAVLAVIALLLYFFIFREKRRTAIERSLGFTRRQCRISLLTAVLALTILAAGTGSVLSGVAMERAGSIQIAAASEDAAQGLPEDAPPEMWDMGGEYNFSAKYSLWAMWDVKGSLAGLEEITPPQSIFLVAPGILILLTLIAAVVIANRNMRVDPVLVIGGEE